MLVIDEEGQKLGIMGVREALTLAQEKGLDLIEVSPNMNPPVCRLMDYGKYKYEQGRREREQQRKNRHQEIKSIKMGPATAEHDFQVRVRQALEFLKKGDKVRVIVQFKGRQITHPELAKRLLDRMVEATAEVGIVEKPAAMEARMMVLQLTPKPEAQRSAEPRPTPSRPASPPQPGLSAAPKDTT